MPVHKDIEISRFTVNCSDKQMCWCRSCMNPGANKGVLTPGVGYAHYYKDPIPECMTRLLHGCPYPQPGMDLENVRCCFRPDYPIWHPSGHRLPKKRETVCRTCGAKAPAWAAVLINTLPTQPGVKCRHQEHCYNLIGGWFWCMDCSGHWDHHPVPWEAPNITQEEYEARLQEVLSRVAQKTP